MYHDVLHRIDSFGLVHCFMSQQIYRSNAKAIAQLVNQLSVNIKANENTMA